MTASARTARTAGTAAWLLAGTALLGGCSPGTIGQAERAVNAQQQDMARLMDMSRSPLPAAQPGRVTISDGVYIPATSVRSMHGMALPERGQVRLDETAASTLPEIARTLTSQLGIPVAIAADLQDSGGGAAAAPTVSAASVQQAVSRLQVADVGAAANASNARNGEITPLTEGPGTMAIRFHGRYQDLLDVISARFNCTYSYNGNTILLSRYITRTFVAHALATNLTLTNTLSGNGSAGGAGGGGSSSGGTSSAAQTISSSIAVKVWDDLLNGVTGVVGQAGRISSNLTTGTITVTAAPSAIEAVQELMDRQNRSLANIINVTAQVFTVTLDNSDTDTFTITDLIKTRGASFGVGNVSTGGGTAGGTTGITPGVSLIAGNTKALLTLLSTVGKVGTRTQSAQSTMSGFVAPFQLTNERGYIASSAVTNTGSSTGGTQTSTTLVPGNVTVGYNIAVLPRVDFADRTVMLQYSISIASLNGANNGFDTFTTPDGLTTVQLKNINQQAFINTTEVPDGTSVVLTGFEQDQDSSNKVGAGSAGFFGASGSQSGRHSRTMTVIILTPTVMRLSHSPITTTGN